MLDVGWICGVAIRAVYWLVMMVCNFLGYSPLWAQVAMKNRKMENFRIRLPSHLAILFTQKEIIRIKEIVELFESCIIAEIRQLSIYDPFSEIVLKTKEVKIICKNLNIDLFCDGQIIHKASCTKMTVNLLSKKMGKETMVETCKMLCKESIDDQITIEKISTHLDKKYRLTDPDFMIRVGNVPSLCGYPPWNLRLTEFIDSPRLPYSRRELDYCIEAFSQRDIRQGK